MNIVFPWTSGTELATKHTNIKPHRSDVFSFDYSFKVLAVARILLSLLIIIYFHLGRNALFFLDLIISDLIPSQKIPIIDFWWKLFLFAAVVALRRPCYRLRRWPSYVKRKLVGQKTENQVRFMMTIDSCNQNHNPTSLSWYPFFI